MSTIAITAPSARRRPFAPLVRAELLKLRRSRGLAWTVAAMTVGSMVVTYGVLVLLHAVNPAHHGPAGGVTNLGHGTFVLSLLGSVAAVLVGTAAGASDLSAGVFSELVVTGRSRLALFAARIPGGLVFLLSLVAVAYSIMAVSTVVFAGSLAAPSVGLLVKVGLWCVLETAFYFVLALSVGSLLGARGQTIGIMLAWRMAVAPILMSIATLSFYRELVGQAGIIRFAPHAILRFVSNGGTYVPMSSAAAVIVIVVWTAAAIGLGAWRTATRDA